MFIQTENTPNPNAIKFLPNTDAGFNQPIHFSSREDVKDKSDLALKLFDIKNITAVFFGADFITVTKSEHSDWKILKPEILMIIMDHFVSGLPVFNDQPKDNPSLGLEEFSEIEKQIIEIIETRVRPSVAMDGGDIIYKGFNNGIVKLELRGSCSGCPSSSITLKNGIESMLKHFIPEIESVEAVNDFE